MAESEAVGNGHAAALAEEQKEKQGEEKEEKKADPGSSATGAVAEGGSAGGEAVGAVEAEAGGEENDEEDEDEEEESFVDDDTGGGTWWSFGKTVTSSLDGVVPISTVTTLFQGREDADGDDSEEEEGEQEETGDQKGEDPLGEARRAATEISKTAQENLGKVGTELASGWGSLNKFIDNMLERPESLGVGDDRKEEDMQSAFQQCFPSLSGDVVDVFPCTMLQKYRCFHNSKTPERTFEIFGRLFITVSHAAFYAPDDGFGQGKALTVETEFTSVEKIQKGQSGMMRIVLKGQSYYIFTRFQGDADFTGALGLLEHMWSEATSAQSTAKPEKTKEVAKPEG